MGNNVCGYTSEDLDKSEITSSGAIDRTEKVLHAIFFIQAFFKARKLKRMFKKIKQELMLAKFQEFFEQNTAKWKKTKENQVAPYKMPIFRSHGQQKTNYFFGNLVHVNETKDKYLGEVDKNNRPHGIGVLVLSDGSIYEGEFVKGVRHGIGRIYHPSLEFYEGEWRDGTPNGKGKYKFADGLVYEGEWLDSQQHGFGKETKENEVYEGFFERGKKNGMGTLRTNYFVYKGGFKDNLFSGKGEMAWGDGRNYQGEWVLGKMHGMGLFEWKDGKKFKGMFEYSKKHGKGTLILPSGNQIDGEWFKGKLMR
jgi:hypothetical protein